MLSTDVSLRPVPPALPLGILSRTSRADSSQTTAQLFRTYGPMVYRRALRMLGNAADAEEATQEIFVRVLRSSDAFSEHAQRSTWLYTVTTNYCLNVIRDRKRRDELDVQHLKWELEDESDADRPVDLAAARSLLASADPQQARAAVYVFVDGLSHAEAAELLGVSRRTVGNLLDRFRDWAQRH